MVRHRISIGVAWVSRTSAFSGYLFDVIDACIKAPTHLGYWFLYSTYGNVEGLEATFVDAMDDGH